MVKVVYDVKYIENSSIIRYKTRLVVQGFIQVYTIDYKKTFALSTCYNTFWIFLVIAAKNK